MVSGYRISDDLSWACTRMRLAGMSEADVLSYTLVSKRQQRRMLAQYRLTGKPFKPKPTRPGRPRKLSFDSAMVRGELPYKICYFTFVQWMRTAISKNCDMYLSDLQEILEVWVGQKVSQGTVWRTLKRMGFTMKQVSNWTFSLRLLNHDRSLVALSNAATINERPISCELDSSTPSN